jgi:hypothetical protein
MGHWHGWVGQVPWIGAASAAERRSCVERRICCVEQGSSCCTTEGRSQIPTRRVEAAASRNSGRGWKQQEKARNGPRGKWIDVVAHTKSR